MHVYDVAVIGAGPAGTTAAIRAAQLKRDTLLIERNTSIGRKLLLTGAGRCNLTNIAPIETFVEKFGASGPFLRQAFYKFSNKNLMDFFEAAGLRLKGERQGRVFPESDRSSSKEVKLFIDLKPGLDETKLEARLLADFSKKGAKQLSGVMEGLLPKRMAPLFIRLSRLDPARQANQITQTERRLLVKMLKVFPLTIEGALSIETGMVTAGGISTKQINPRTMESKLLPGLYFAGEIIDSAAPSGGYNLQQAFSTGFLAGEAAANA